MAEELLYWKPLGRICLLTVNKTSLELTRNELVISSDNHLSYPFVAGSTVVPEQSSSGGLYAYLLDGGRQKTTEVLNEGLIDATFLEHQDRYWVFGTLPGSEVTQLHIYYSCAPMENFTQHASNPVKNDIRSARPAGSFFTFRGDIYRPAQDCLERYGRCVRIMKIVALTPTDFEEEEVLRLSSDSFEPFSQGLHTFNVNQDVILVDGYRERTSWFVKPLLRRTPVFAWMNRDKRMSHATTEFKRVRGVAGLGAAAPGNPKPAWSPQSIIGVGTRPSEHFDFERVWGVHAMFLTVVGSRTCCSGHQRLVDHAAVVRS